MFHRYHLTNETVSHQQAGDLVGRDISSYSTNSTNSGLILNLLNDALATELIFMLRYRRHYFTAKAVNSTSVSDEFLQYYNVENINVDNIADRIVQLNGEPDFSPDTITGRSCVEYMDGDSVVEMIKENLVAERIAIVSYRDGIQLIGDEDLITRRLFEEILTQKARHGEELADLLEDNLTAFTIVN